MGNKYSEFITHRFLLKLIFGIYWIIDDIYSSIFFVIWLGHGYCEFIIYKVNLFIIDPARHKGGSWELRIYRRYYNSVIDT